MKTTAEIIELARKQDSYKYRNEDGTFILTKGYNDELISRCNSISEAVEQANFLMEMCLAFVPSTIHSGNGLKCILNTINDGIFFKIWKA